MGKPALLERLQRNKAHVRKRLEIDLAWAARANPPSIARRAWLRQHLEKQSGRCHYCRIAMRRRLNEPDRHPTIDHFIPLCEGGPDAFENTVAACAACNNAKGSLLPEDFQASTFLNARKQIVNTPPDRLSVAIGNKYYDQDVLRRGLTILFNDRELGNVEEYCLSEGWVAVPAGKAKTKTGRPVTIKKYGKLIVQFKDNKSVARTNKIPLASRDSSQTPPNSSHRTRSRSVNLHERPQDIVVIIKQPHEKCTVKRT